MHPSTSPRLPPKSPPASPPPWLADLRTQCDDLIAAALDATSPPSRRTLGRTEARRQVREAATKCRAIFALAQEAAP